MPGIRQYHKWSFKIAKRNRNEEVLTSFLRETANYHTLHFWIGKMYYLRIPSGQRHDSGSFPLSTWRRNSLANQVYVKNISCFGKEFFSYSLFLSRLWVTCFVLCNLEQQSYLRTHFQQVSFSLEEIGSHCLVGHPLPTEKGDPDDGQWCPQASSLQ